MPSLMHIISRVLFFFQYPVARLFVAALSEKKHLQSIGKKPKLLWENDLQGRSILLLALYEKGVLRPDIQRLLKEAKAQGIYVLGVNTLKLKNPEQYKDIIDCYIEKFNFGRDFSSYKTGFLHIYKRGWEAECARVLMANDSVFYTSKGLKKFLRDMMETDVEVLGSTENFERSYHLGSFCISISCQILQNKKLKSYWRKYKLTDVRPVVIRRGEMGLTKALKKCISSDLNYQALLNVTNFLKSVEANPSIIDFYLQNQRSSEHITAWKKVSAKSIVNLISKKYLFNRNKKSKNGFMISEIDHKLFDEYYLDTVDNIMAYLKSVTSDETSPNRELITKIIIAELSEAFISGSQVHQNAPILLNIGLPFVKLDGQYRGAFNQEDIYNITRQLNKIDANELQNLLSNRPYGGATLFGWKLVAFMGGLI